MRRTRGFLSGTLTLFLCALCVVPFLCVFAASLRNTDGAFTLMHYYRVFIGQPQYLLRFWKSIGLGAVIAIGQVIVSALAAWGFARYRFPGRNALFFLLMILMILPVQVTLIPNYIILERVNLLYTYAALALPAIILPLGTFILTHSFRALSDNVIEAARLDGCSLPSLLMKVVIPMSRNALICVFLLSFLDSWNMVEQPITYLKDFADYPLAVGLAIAPPGDPGVLLAACVLDALAPLFLFALFNRELTEGITLGVEQ